MTARFDLRAGIVFRRCRRRSDADRASSAAPSPTRGVAVGNGIEPGAQFDLVDPPAFPILVCGDLARLELPQQDLVVSLRSAANSAAVRNRVSRIEGPRNHLLLGCCHTIQYFLVLSGGKSGPPGRRPGGGPRAAGC